MKGELKIKVEARRIEFGMLDFKETTIKDSRPVSAQIQCHAYEDQSRGEQRL